MKGWTIEHIENLKKQGKIRGYTVKKRKKETTQGRIVAKHFQKRSKEKDWMAWNLLKWANDHAIQLQEEYPFHPERKWRADWALTAIRCLIEYEGLMSDKSGHTTIQGYTKDTEKYREASKAGWIVLRYTALNYKDVINDLNEILKNQST